MSTVIELRTPDNIRIPFSLGTRVALRAVPDVILPILQQDVHKFSNDLLLKLNVKIAKHFFVVYELIEGVKYSVIAIPCSAVRHGTFEEITKYAATKHDDIFGQNSYSSETARVRSNDGLITQTRPTRVCSPGACILLRLYPTPEHTAESNILVPEDGGSEVENTVPFAAPVEHVSSTNDKVFTRENQVLAEAVKSSVSTDGGKFRPEMFQHVSPEIDGNSIKEDSQFDGTLFEDRYIENLHQGAKDQPAAQLESSPLIHHGASSTSLQAVGDEDVDARSCGDFKGDGEGVIHQAEDDSGCSNEPPVEQFGNLEIQRFYKLREKDNLGADVKLKQSEEKCKLEWKPEQVMSSQEQAKSQSIGVAEIECKDQENHSYEQQLAEQHVLPRDAKSSGLYLMEHAAGNLKQAGDAGRQIVPNVKDTGFLPLAAYNYLRKGTIIYSKEDCLTLSLSYPLPKMDYTLGRGGNGRVVSHIVDQKVFAVKKTKYRSRELNTWIKLEQNNLMPLLAVMIDAEKGDCYQFMPRMKETLNDVIETHGTLRHLSRNADSDEWELVSLNILYIIKSVLKGLQFLEEHHMQHCDVKARNILLGECECSSSCTDVLHCKCPDLKKFVVMLADFDSIKETEKHVDPPLSQANCIPNKEKLMGTCGYGAPEQKFFPDPPCEKNIMDGHVKSHTESTLGGPWSDMWSFGVMLSRICCGKPTEANINDANILRQHPSSPNIITRANEDILALIDLQRLTEAAMMDSNLKTLASIASSCLQPKSKERLTAKTVLCFHCM